MADFETNLPTFRTAFAAPQAMHENLYKYTVRRYYRYECVPSQDAEKEIFGRYTNFVRITAYFKQFHTRIFGILDVFLKGLEFSKKV